MAFSFLLQCIQTEERGMPMTKIIYLDIDGTLRDERIGIPESAEAALRICREQGILIIICTGRNPGSIQRDVKALEIDGMISGGGAYIEFGDRQVQENFFPMRVLADVLEVIRKRKLGAALEGREEIYMNAKAALFYREDFEKKIAGLRDISRIMEENRIRYEDNFSELWKESGKIHKICIIGPKQDIDRIAEYFEEKSEIAQKIEWNGLWYIELLPAGCGKGEAVDFLNDRLGIAREESMGFGDGENDIGMLRSVGIGVAVEGAGEGLLKYADSICEKPVDDGIYRELVRRNVIREEIGQNRIKEKIGQSRIEEETPVERRA